MSHVIYALAPKGYRSWVDRHIDYCNLEVKPAKLMSFFFLSSFVVGFLAGIFVELAGAPLEYMFLSWGGVFLLCLLVMHLALIMIADSRANLVETILPDALQIISANMRSGLTPDRAILASARPEFGPLEAELKRVSKETLSGKSFEEAMRGITKRIKSSILQKTVELVVEGMSKGGSLTTLLDSIADDVRQVKLLRGEIKSFVIMYGIFIFFAAAIGAPLLYSVSTFMVQTLNNLSSSVGDVDVLTSGSSSTALSLFKFKPSTVTTDFLLQYSAVAIFVTCIFGSLIIGLVQDGTEKAGLKYIPVMLLISFAVFLGSQAILSSLFASVAG